MALENESKHNKRFVHETCLPQWLAVTGYAMTRVVLLDLSGTVATIPCHVLPEDAVERTQFMWNHCAALLTLLEEIKVPIGLNPDHCSVAMELWNPQDRGGGETDRCQERKGGQSPF